MVVWHTVWFFVWFIGTYGLMYLHIQDKLGWNRFFVATLVQIGFAGMMWHMIALNAVLNPK